MSKNRLSGSLEDFVGAGAAGLLKIYLKRVLALFVIAAIIVFFFLSLGGCYMLDKELNGSFPAIIITNTTQLALEIIENGSPLKNRLRPSEHLVIRANRALENRTDTLHILIKAWSLDGTVFAGVTEYTFHISHRYSSQTMDYSNNCPQSWIIGIHDLYQ